MNQPADIHPNKAKRPAGDDEFIAVDAYPGRRTPIAVARLAAWRLAWPPPPATSWDVTRYPVGHLQCRRSRRQKAGHPRRGHRPDRIPAADLQGKPAVPIRQCLDHVVGVACVAWQIVTRACLQAADAGGQARIVLQHGAVELAVGEPDHAVGDKTLPTLPKIAREPGEWTIPGTCQQCHFCFRAGSRCAWHVVVHRRWQALGCSCPPTT